MTLPEDPKLTDNTIAFATGAGILCAMCLGVLSGTVIGFIIKSIWRLLL